jgi:iron complex transport system permease protein
MSRRLAMQRLTARSFAAPFLAGSLLLIVAIPLALSLGSDGFSFGAMLDAVFGRADPAVQTIVLTLRMPRVLLAVGVGGALAITGAMFQALLRNPLAEPYILGISNGCAVGAILGINASVVFSALGLGAATGSAYVTLFSFVGGLIVVLIVLWIGRSSGGPYSESMLLGGVMVAAVGAALIFLLLHLMPDVRGAIQWMLGDLSGASKGIGYAAMALFGLLLIGSLLTGNTFNAISLGDEQAASLGFNVRRTTLISYLVASLVIGTATSFCGAIGFVGLVVPHALRKIVGPDHRLLLPLSVLGGALFLLVCDTIARSVLPATGASGGELPVGAITALIGAPFFIRLLVRRPVA